MQEFLKTGTNHRLQYEIASLNWLTEAQHNCGAQIVKILAFDSQGLHLELLQNGQINPKSARDFGRALAQTHAAGAMVWGAAPQGWKYPNAFKGMMPMSVVAVFQEKESPSTPKKSNYTVAPKNTKFGEWLVNERLYPAADMSARKGHLPSNLINSLEKLYKKLQNGDFDSPQPTLVKTTAARLHGDLWAGNLIWTPQGIVLIDPSAYGGHAETDLAECELFGTPHINEIYAGYNEVSPLESDWKNRIKLHQLYMLLVHLALFGNSYLPSVHQVVKQYV